MFSVLLCCVCCCIVLASRFLLFSGLLCCEYCRGFVFSFSSAAANASLVHERCLLPIPPQIRLLCVKILFCDPLFRTCFVPQGNSHQRENLLTQNFHLTEQECLTKIEEDTPVKAKKPAPSDVSWGSAVRCEVRDSEGYYIPGTCYILVGCMKLSKYFLSLFMHVFFFYIAL